MQSSFIITDESLDFHTHQNIFLNDVLKQIRIHIKDKRYSILYPKGVLKILQRKSCYVDVLYAYTKNDDMILFYKKCKKGRKKRFNREYNREYNSNVTSIKQLCAFVEFYIDTYSIMTYEHNLTTEIYIVIDLSKLVIFDTSVLLRKYISLIDISTLVPLDLVKLICDYILRHEEDVELSHEGVELNFGKHTLENLDKLLYINDKLIINNYNVELK